ncbi:Maf family protein [Paracoccaceae bacterium]
MHRPLILASGSEIRLQLLRNAGLDVTAQVARIDEAMIRTGLEAEAANPRDIADTLAEMKAARVAARTNAALVLGCDQVLEFRHKIWGKPETREEAHAQLTALRGKTHKLLSALVLYDAGEPVWRHIGEAQLSMRPFSDSFLDGYLDRNWPSVGQSVGGYKLEQEGIRLFDRIEGDHFTILGLPLLPLLTYLGTRGFIET